MTYDPVEMAARYANAARVCGDPVPCGWCLWRAGYRKGRRPRLPRIPRGVAGGPDLFTQPDPAAPGSNDNERGNMADWKIKIGDNDATTIRAETRREAIDIATARGGVVRVVSAEVVDGFDRGVQVADYEITTRAKRVRAGASEDAAGEVADG